MRRPPRRSTANDPAWKKAEDEANAAYAELQKDPTKFEDMAKAEQ